MSELAVSNASVSGSIQIQSMDDLSRVSKMLSASGFFSDAKDAAQCGVKVLAGAEMGFGAFASMCGIHIVKGKPSVGANLMAAAVKRHPNYNYKVLEHTAEVCRIAFYEKWDGKFEQMGISEFTIADAKRAGTQNLDKFPRNMLFARAMSNGVRWYCPDIFDAPVYTPEELGAPVDEEGNYIEAHVVESIPKPAPVPQEMPTQGISMEQRKRMFAIAKECGVTEDQIKETIMDQFGITSTKELTQDNYRSLIYWIESQRIAPVHEQIPDGDPEADEPLQF